MWLFGVDGDGVIRVSVSRIDYEVNRSHILARQLSTVLWISESTNTIWLIKPNWAILALIDLDLHASIHPYSANIYSHHFIRSKYSTHIQ